MEKSSVNEPINQSLTLTNTIADFHNKSYEFKNSSSEMKSMKKPKEKKTIISIQLVELCKKVMEKKREY